MGIGFITCGDNTGFSVSADEARMKDPE